MMRITLTAITLLAAVFATTGSFAAGSSGGGDISNVSTATPKTPEQIANGHYKSGLKHKKKAWKNEAKAAKYDDQAKREKYLTRAQKSYGKAVDKQTEALKFYPAHYEAANELGYALRKTGDYKKAIGAYNYALKINPKFYQAIEYRGEALLALGLIGNAKQDYMELFRGDRELAQQLMLAMVTWFKSQDLQTDSVTEFGVWISERQVLAQMTQDLSANNARGWEAQ
ncbi:MAG: tetratricopeptide repeat protein [Gammaproteobacteria bacterium]|nr:MAG: tetratricopeptide repeat protein [Gammaproteobacteria bacterium]